MNPNVIIRKIVRTNNIKLSTTKELKVEDDIEIEINDKSIQISDIVADDLKMKVIIWGEEGLKYKRCYCCRRKIPADIVAHINIKSDITVHRRDCKILKSVNKDRLLSAYIKWNEQEELWFFVNVVFQNETWILKRLTEIIFSMEIDIDEINSKKQWSKFMSFDLRLKVPNHDYLVIDRFIERVQFAFEDDLINYRIEEV